MVENSVNRASIVNEGNLVLTKFTQSPKNVVEFLVVTELYLVNKGNLFRISVYLAGSANEGF